MDRMSGEREREKERGIEREREREREEDEDREMISLFPWIPFNQSSLYI